MKAWVLLVAFIFSVGHLSFLKAQEGEEDTSVDDSGYEQTWTTESDDTEYPLDNPVSYPEDSVIEEPQEEEPVSVFDIKKKNTKKIAQEKAKKKSSADK